MSGSASITQRIEAIGTRIGTPTPRASPNRYRRRRVPRSACRRFAGRSVRRSAVRAAFDPLPGRSTPPRRRASARGVSGRHRAAPPAVARLQHHVPSRHDRRSHVRPAAQREQSPDRRAPRCRGGLAVGARRRPDRGGADLGAGARAHQQRRPAHDGVERRPRTRPAGVAHVVAAGSRPRRPRSRRGPCPRGSDGDVARPRVPVGAARRCLAARRRRPDRRDGCRRRRRPVGHHRRTAGRVRRGA